jgi:hypothetical protein
MRILQNAYEIACNVIEQRKGDAVQQLNTVLSQKTPEFNWPQIFGMDLKIDENNSKMPTK